MLAEGMFDPGNMFINPALFSGAEATLQLNALSNFAAVTESANNAVHVLSATLVRPIVFAENYYLYVDVKRANQFRVRLKIGDGTNFGYNNFNILSGVNLSHGDEGDSSFTAPSDGTNQAMSQLADSVRRLRAIVTLPVCSQVVIGIECVNSADEAVTYAGDNTQAAFYFRSVRFVSVANDPGYLAYI